MRDSNFITNVYLGKEYFCDRENELNILYKMLKNDTNYLLISRKKLNRTLRSVCYLHFFINFIKQTRKRNEKYTM